jgi:hypothetical protein
VSVHAAKTTPWTASDEPRLVADLWDWLTNGDGRTCRHTAPYAGVHYVELHFRAKLVARGSGETARDALADALARAVGGRRA